MSETYDFRVRATLGDTTRIDSDLSELLLETDGGITVAIRTMADRPFRDSNEIQLRGSGYADETEARTAGETWRDAVTVGFARVQLAADFRERAPRGFIAPAHLDELRAAHPEVQQYNDDPGVLVFPSAPPALFHRIEARGVVVKRGEQVAAMVKEAHERGLGVSDVQRLAFDLWSASFSLSVADARFVMLTMALETLIEQVDRPLAVQEQLKKLVVSVEEAGLPEGDAASLVGGLRALRQESVGQAGRRLSTALADRLYLGMPALKFFSYCYGLRSTLVHGAHPRPSRDEVDLAAAHWSDSSVTCLHGNFSTFRCSEIRRRPCDQN
ncbi:hypothetical protein SAMN04488107_1087 [Geodermatophilus saharensis]|uniref:Apea-like HEPN domain-containing protein n=1 Tax=Geodermatophilus saharensis TaxID=1137994 RepID=A0A239BCY8_9ACTN|nr:hypothetical protein [Geodermatophilus saharensis]SNS05569.1 hypothetical protein SAMN04488107_1087 [Geodermatophilus saharensis]